MQLLSMLQKNLANSRTDLGIHGCREGLWLLCSCDEAEGDRPADLACPCYERSTGLGLRTTGVSDERYVARQPNVPQEVSVRACRGKVIGGVQSKRARCKTRSWVDLFG